MKNTVNHIKILILALVLSAGIGTLSAWTNPPGTPPTCPSGTPGCDAPLHIGPAGQIKSGGLSVGSGLTDAGVGFAVLGGKMGIGTAAPTQKLDVAGYIKSTTGFCIGTNCITSWPSGGTGNIRAESGHNIITENCDGNTVTVSGEQLCDGDWYTDISFGTAFNANPHIIVVPEVLTYTPPGQSNCSGGSTDKIIARPTQISKNGFRMVVSGSPSGVCGSYEGWRTKGRGGWMAVGS